MTLANTRMGRQGSFNIKCPHCQSLCQFNALLSGTRHLIESADTSYHEAFMCTSCGGLIIALWRLENGSYYLSECFPSAGDFTPKVDLNFIEKEEVKNDFKEAIDCYNNNLYNASMIMSRRAIQQDVSTESNKNENLWEQIKSTDISQSFKDMLDKVRVFGNHGAHPDFCFYDKDETPIKEDSKKEVAATTLYFLDHYFMHKYEMPKRISEQPKSQKKLSKKQ